MTFSSLTFLWFFLPIVFLMYQVVPKKAKNIWLLGTSLLFYGWGEPKYIVLMIVSILLNYASGLLIDRKKRSPLMMNKIILAICILLNLLLLGYFKYFNLLIDSVNHLAGGEVLTFSRVLLPIGISFYTFQALSYVIDLYRNETQVQKNLIHFALYVTFFPQLIAGPIVKYHDIAKQLDERIADSDKIVLGIKRFIIGFAKKVILSNSFAAISDQILELEYKNIGTILAWTAMILYSLHIYYDFSGYSDMAIGLGKMFGFDFLENFNFPYLADSVKNFWTRWHISLSTWFKEYLYIPLGGNRKGHYRTYLNLLIVFFLTGLWHGASYTFVIWGLFHGFFLIVERVFLGKFLERNNLKFLNHIYTLLVVIVGWVFFRIESLSGSLELLGQMFIPQRGMYNLTQFINAKSILLLLLGILFCGIFQKSFPKFYTKITDEKQNRLFVYAVLLVLFAIGTVFLVTNTYNPFIYYRF